MNQERNGTGDQVLDINTKVQVNIKFSSFLGSY